MSMTDASSLLSDQELDDLNQAACFGDYGRDGSEISSLVAEVRYLRTTIKLSPLVHEAMEEMLLQLRADVERMRPLYEAALKIESPGFSHSECFNNRPCVECDFVEARDAALAKEKK